jgi:tRNA(His) 5'-end guanylyltransferase
MTGDNTALGDRMKRYELPTRLYLPRRTYSILRVDGRAFHTLLANARKPFDPEVIRAMDQVARALVGAIDGAVFAYTQSDEVSVLVQDFASTGTEPWFGGRADKWCSIGAAIATQRFTAYQHELRPVDPEDREAPEWAYMPAHFDGRVLTINDPVEVANYFVWRQRDWTRNSIQMLAQANFPHAELTGLNTDQLQEKLHRERGINWAQLSDDLKRGRVVHRPIIRPGVRAEYWAVTAAPRFQAAPGTWLAAAIPPLPDLELAPKDRVYNGCPWSVSGECLEVESGFAECPQGECLREQAREAARDCE